MDKREAIAKVKQYKLLPDDHFDLESVYVHDSCAKDTSTDYSDIDIAVLVDNLEGDFLDHEAGLYKLRRNIDLSIEPVLFTNRIDKSGFLDSILSYGEIVYQRQ